MNYSTLWVTTLAELKLQMTSATYNSRLLRTVGREREGALEVVATGESGRDWLDNRLRVVIERAVARVAGQPVEVRFVVEEEEKKASPQPASPIPIPSSTSTSERVAPSSRMGFVMPEFDVHDAGWFPVSGYESRFWGAVLGRVAWRVWEVIREGDRRRKKTAWTVQQRWTAPAMAEQVPCGRQALTGVSRRCEEGTLGAAIDEKGIWRRHRPGAFDRLVDEGVAIIEERGKWRHRTYLISVKMKLGLLWPRQVLALPARLQVAHDRWLEGQGMDPRSWDVGIDSN